MKKSSLIDTLFLFVIIEGKNLVIFRTCEYGWKAFIEARLNLKEEHFFYVN